MRLWSIHPSYLDQKGLVALWRETLLAQKVLMGQTKGYKNHSQLVRFKQHSDPVAAIGSYLRTIAAEAVKRGYNFNVSKIISNEPAHTIKVTTGQLEYEFYHLLSKLEKRDPKRFDELVDTLTIETNSFFEQTTGPVADWEKV